MPIFLSKAEVTRVDTYLLINNKSYLGYRLSVYSFQFYRDVNKATEYKAKATARAFTAKAKAEAKVKTKCIAQSWTLSLIHISEPTRPY